MIKNRPEVKAALWNSRPGQCGICGEELCFEKATIDHIIATTRGGTDDLSNLQLAHRECNTGKGNRVLEGLRPRPVKKEGGRIMVGFHLSDAQEDILKGYARQEGRTVTSIVREMIRSLEAKILP